VLSLDAPDLSAYNPVMTEQDVLIDVSANTEGSDDVWRVHSHGRADAFFTHETEAVDEALARLTGRDGQIYKRDPHSPEPVPFNPNGG
jgi:hypothetical protein